MKKIYKPEELVGRYIRVTNDEGCSVKLIKFIPLNVSYESDRWVYEAFIYTSNIVGDKMTLCDNFYVRKDKSDWVFTTEDEIMAGMI